MRRGLFAFTLATIFTLGGCLGGNQHYRPSDDPLVLAHFEKIMVAEGISYRVDYQGYYRAVQAADAGRMRSAGSDALEIDPGRESVQVDEGCASLRLLQYLGDNDVVFIQQQEAEGTFLQMTEADYVRLEVAKNFETFKTECSGG